MKLLFISNGHGEDAIGARLAQEFKTLHPDWLLEAVPIVGRGMPYERLGVVVSGPRWEPPSGGFTFTSLRLLWGDVQDGMFAKTHDQHWAVRRSKPDAIVVVGDVYALWVTFSFAFKDMALVLRPPVFQVQPLVSRYYQDGLTGRERLERANRVTVDGFVGPELRYMQRVRRVFARDERTAAWLQELGVPHAAFAGNVMMDTLVPERDLAGLLDGRPVLALLPGSRQDFLESLPVMLQAVEHLPQFQPIAAFAGDVARVALPQGWRLEVVNEAGVLLHGSGAQVLVLPDAFAAVLHAASVVLGTAGTANEQAVGLGKPVVGFATRGPQYTVSFAKAQQRLLGAGLRLEPNDALRLAGAVQELALDATRRATVRAVGLERMSVAGGAARVVQGILEGLRV